MPFYYYSYYEIAHILIQENKKKEMNNIIFQLSYVTDMVTSNIDVRNNVLSFLQNYELEYKYDQFYAKLNILDISNNFEKCYKTPYICNKIVQLHPSAIRLFNVAIMDVLFTIIGSIIISHFIKISYYPIRNILIITLFFFLLGILLHIFFCVKTTVDKMLFS